MTPEFKPFAPIPRLRRPIVITEKIDGTNAVIHVPEDDGPLIAGSRNRWVVGLEEHFGFRVWVETHADQLRELGPGTHFGEWWGPGVGRRGYGLKEKRFSLFNTHRWSDDAVRPRPACCHVVPILYSGPFTTSAVEECLATLAKEGSRAAPGFMAPEGIVVFHIAGNLLFKATIEHDEESKTVTASRRGASA